MKRWATIPLVLILGVLLCPSTALGQGATTASIRGQVTDANGQPLPGANVLAVHVPSGTEYGASTNENGQYTLANLRPGGPYRVTASFVGYQSKREEGFTLDLGQTLTLNFTLPEKTAKMDEVEVVAKTTGILSSERDGLVTNVSSAELEQQPTMSRSIADVARLTPQSYVVNSNDDGPAISIAGQWNRFNSIYVDGAVTNDVFGLSAQGTPGGQSGASPISLSAVEAMSVEVSPYEVTKSGFVGGAINFTTKSGTNEFKGSFEYYRRGASLTQSKLTVDGETVVDGLPSTTSSDRYVFSLGGPIIKDRLFFFVNADIRRQNEGKPLQPGYDGATPLRGGSLNNNTLDSVFEIRDFMQQNTGYDPGTPGSKVDVLNADKFLARIDFNLNQNHKLTARYWYNDNFNRDRFQSTQDEINFENTSEVFPSTQHNAMLRWNGSFGNQVATKTSLTLQNVVDDRGVEGEPFPHISITDGPGASIELGSELFSYPNFLEQTVVTFTNQTDIFLGDHTVTVGTHNEFYSIDNRFAIFGPGLYTFNNVSDFAETVCHYAQQPNKPGSPGPICQAQYPNPSPKTNFYIHQYSLLDDNPQTEQFEQGVDDDTKLRSDFNSTKLGFFVQDKWQPLDRLNLTFGVRADLPKILTDPGAHPSANKEVIPKIKNAGYNLHGATAGKMPDWQVFWAPRFGFNYALTKERNTQIRGGTGVFTSRLPQLWPGAAYLNNGKSADVAVGLGFAGPLPLRRPKNGLTKLTPGVGIFGGGAFGATPPSSVSELTPTGNLILFREDFSYPRVLRTTLAIDRELPFGFTGTLEGQYTSKLKSMVVKNVNLKKPNATLEPGQTNDDRPVYTQRRDPNTSINVDSRYGDIFLLDNTEKGYSYSITARLQKESTPVWDGGTVRGNLSYTYGDARSKNQFGDTVGSNWGDNPHKSTTNSLTLGRSPFSLGHRIQLSLAYRQEFTENVSTNLSLYYSGQSGRPFSYTIGGEAAANMVGDEGGPPLFYIPKDASNLTFAPIMRDGKVVRTPQQQAQDLERFIQNVEYLSNNRGEYALRNGDRTPFEGVLDLQFALNFSGELVGRNQRLSLTANFFNFSSFLGDIFGTEWGYRYQQASLVNPVDFAGFTDGDGDGQKLTPVYQSALGTENPDKNLEDIFEVESGSQTYSTLYQVRLGVKYTF